MTVGAVFGAGIGALLYKALMWITANWKLIVSASAVLGLAGGIASSFLTASQSKEIQNVVAVVMSLIPLMTLIMVMNLMMTLMTSMTKMIEGD